MAQSVSFPQSPRCPHKSREISLAQSIESDGRPGRKMGQQWVAPAASSSLVWATGVPPESEMRNRGISKDGVKRMTPSLFQVPARPSGASQIDCTGLRTPLLSAACLPKKPMYRLSATKRHNCPPACSVAAARHPNPRSAPNCSPESSRAANASSLPSGDITAGPPATPTGAKWVFSGGRIEGRTTWVPAVTWPSI
jgi:hypothetical protein